MPDEHVGVVKENYQWKVGVSLFTGVMSPFSCVHAWSLCFFAYTSVFMFTVYIRRQLAHMHPCSLPTRTIYTLSSFLKVLLYRSSSPDAVYHPVSVSSFNQDLFLLCWSPTVAALSYVFENAEQKSVVQKAINGFRSVS